MVQPLIDDNKRGERIPVYLSERELLDASRLAATMDKKTSEYIRYALRLTMYGSIGMARRECNEINSADSGDSVRGEL